MAFVRFLVRQSWAATFALALVLGLSAHVAPATAGVAISGWGEGGDGFSLGVNPDEVSFAYPNPNRETSQQSPVLFIARQPADKTVGFAQVSGLHINPGCHSPVFVKLTVYQYDNDSLEPRYGAGTSTHVVAESDFPSLLGTGAADGFGRWVFKDPLDLKKGASYGLVVSVDGIATETDPNNSEQVANKQFCNSTPLQVTTYPAVDPPKPDDPACEGMPYHWTNSGGVTLDFVRVWMNLAYLTPAEMGSSSEGPNYPSDADYQRMNEICAQGLKVGQTGGDVWAMGITSPTTQGDLHPLGFVRDYTADVGQSDQAAKDIARQSLCGEPSHPDTDFPDAADLIRGELFRTSVEPGNRFEALVLHKCSWARIYPGANDANAVSGWVWSYPTGPGLPNSSGVREPNTPQIVKAQLDVEVPDGIGVSDLRELLGGVNPAAPELPRCNTGDPIDCSTGNFYENVTDLAIPGRGVTLSVDRTYNAQAAAGTTTPGIFGIGWSSPFEMSLTTVGSGGIVITHGNGSTVSFKSNGSGGYVAAGWVRARLTRDSAGLWTYELPDHTKYGFSSDGLLNSITNETGVKVSLLRDSSQRVYWISGGMRSLSLSYNSAGRVSQAQDSAGRTVVYAYNAANTQLLSVTNPLGGVSSYTYDTKNRMLTMKTPRGSTTTNAYGSLNRVSQQTDPNGGITKLAYTGYFGSSQTTVTDRDGVVTRKTFSGGSPISETRGYGTPSAQTARMVHTEQGLLKRLTDARGGITKYRYNADGLPTSVTDALGNATTSTYDSRGHLTQSTSPEGRRTTYTYDAAGNLLRALHDTTNAALGSGTTQENYTYDNYGQRLTATDTAGRITRYVYDGGGNRTKVTTPAGRVTTYTYDGAGNVLSQTLPAGNVTGGSATGNQIVYTRDAVGRPLTVKDATGGTSTSTYDADGNLVASRNADNNLTTFVYDAGGRMTQQTRPGGGVDKWTYTAEGHPVSHTDATGEITVTHTYDELGREASRKDAGNNVTTTQWNLGGNKVISPDAAQVTTSTDLLGRVTSVGVYRQNGATALQRSYVYDADGNVTREQVGSASSQDTPFRKTANMTYNALGQLTSRNQGAQDTRLRPSTTYFGYNATGQVSYMYYGNGIQFPTAAGSTATTADFGAVNYVYDDDDNMTRATDWGGRQFNFTYDANGALATAIYPNATSTYTRDAMSRPLQITTPVGNRSYTYSPAGVPKSVALGATNKTLSVDAADHLLAYGSQTNAFDAAENLTAMKEVNGDPVEITHGTNGQIGNRIRTGSQNQASFYYYDTLGRRTREDYQTSAVASVYQYDELDQLVLAHERTRAGTNNYEDINIGYGATGLLMTLSRGGTTKYENYAEGIGANAPLLSDGLDAYVYGPGGRLLERVNGQTNTAEFQWQDAIGTVIGGTSESGVATPLTYDAWGRRTDASEASSLAVGTLGFAGQQQMPGMDLTYMRARWYDPRTASFLTRDPEEASTLQPYLYAGGNPSMNTDPSGESFAGDFANGMIQGLSNDLIKPGSAAGSCSWAYFLGLQAGGAFDPLKKAKKLQEILHEVRAGRKATKAVDEVAVGYHYTRKDLASAIQEIGLLKGSYVTSNGDLSPLQAQIDLALPPNRGLPGLIVQVDLAAMRKDGIDVGAFTQVGRKYGMPGGGTEVQISSAIPARYVRVLNP